MNAPTPLSFRATAGGGETKDTRKNKYDKISSRVINKLNHSSITNQNDFANNKYKYDPAFGSSSSRNWNVSFND